jgi:hypothetical protein
VVHFKLTPGLKGEQTQIIFANILNINNSQYAQSLRSSRRELPRGWAEHDYLLLIYAIGMTRTIITLFIEKRYLKIDRWDYVNSH